MSVIATPSKPVFERAVTDRMFFAGRSCIESVLEVCEKYGIFPEDAGDLISEPLKERLKVEFQKTHMLPSEKTNNIFDVDTEE